jgi:hypothetical protein
MTKPTQRARAAALALLPLAVALPAAAAADPDALAAATKILFVGNSYTFGRVDPVLSYNAANVHDLTAAFNALNPTGTNSYPIGTVGFGTYEQHPWGGVPGIFKKMTDEAGLNYDVSLSTRNAATLRGQFLNSANAAWDLRGNVASQSWDTVVLQTQSDEPLPVGKGKNAAPATFTTYATTFEKYIHTGLIGVGTVSGNNITYTENQLYGSAANCTAAATGLSAGSCNTSRTVPKNANFNPNTKVYIEETWARPDMVEAHKVTTPDLNSPSGAPIVDTSGGASGTAATLYYTSAASTAANLAAMTADMHAAFYGLAAADSGIAGVIPVGDAFQRAVDQGLVLGSGFYNADGTYVEPTDGTINLWWLDRTHASMYGSYLSALTTFGRITGLDPRSLGAGELAGADLGISSSIVLTLEQVAAEQLGFAAAVPEPATSALMGVGVLALLAGVKRARVQA